MKILFVCQYYAPEPFRHPDMCEELVRRGHEVTVVTGTPNYPMGVTYDDYKHGAHRDEVLNGVKVHRCRTIARRNNAFFRLLNYYSFVISSRLYVKKLRGDFDLVFVHQLSPVIMAEAGIDYARKHKIPLFLYCLDIWPESMVIGNIKKSSPIFKYFRFASERIYKAADKLLISSQGFAEYFEKEFGITDTIYLPQYAESIFTPEACRKEPDGFIDLMFAGNIGKAQSIDTIIEAARLTQDIKNLRWHIVGEGSELARIKALASSLPQVIFHGRKPLDEMPAYYAKADAMLITMKATKNLSRTIPGKVQTYLAAGKPILGAIDGETRRYIEETKSGLIAPAQDAPDLAEKVREYVRIKESGGEIEVNSEAFDWYKLFEKILAQEP